MRIRLRSALLIIAGLAIIFAFLVYDPLRKDMSIFRGIGQQADADVSFLYEDEVPFYRFLPNDVVGVFRVKQPKWVPVRSRWLQRRFFTRVDTVFVGESLMTDELFDELGKASALKVVVLPHYASAVANMQPSDETLERFLQAKPEAVVVADEKVWIGSSSNRQRYLETYRAPPSSRFNE